MQTTPHILILGGKGMLGQTVYRYLKSNFHNTWATSRDNDDDFLYFDASSPEENLEDIQKKLESIDYIINCIGILKNSSNIEEMYYINGKLPHILATIASQNNCKIIHISTDGVFSDSSGLVDEITKPTPQDDYGKSKLMGELTDEHTLTIRTSFIGLDPLHHRGLLEWVLENEETTIKGYTNQLWTGCTTLQVAIFCSWLIRDANWEEIRKRSPILHFVPLGPVTKFTIIKTFLSLLHKKTDVVEITGLPITRSLQTKFLDGELKEMYTNKLKDALLSLIQFHKPYVTI